MSGAGVIEFWFGPAPFVPRPRLWWLGGPSVDGEIAERFGSLLDDALAGRLEDWRRTAEGCLALVLLLDQFTRHCFRGSARAFTGDAEACEVALEAVDRAFDQELHPLQRAFLYMPFEHAESRAMQRLATASFAELVETAPAELAADLASSHEHATAHRAIVERFGRFPHRNRALGRESTPAEVAWLAQDGRRFGQG